LKNEIARSPISSMNPELARLEAGEAENDEGDQALYLHIGNLFRSALPQNMDLLAHATELGLERESRFRQPWGRRR